MRWTRHKNYGLRAWSTGLALLPNAHIENRYHHGVPVLVRAAPRDVNAIRSALAMAFLEDPVARWLFPDTATRGSDLASFFSIQLRHGYLPRGTVMSTSNFVSTAMWIESWTKPPGWIDRLAHLQIPLLLRSRFGPARELTRSLTDAHPSVPHLYLGTIGTIPRAQSRGYGTSLVDAFIAQADNKGVGAYLECSCETNVSFYEHRGFCIQREVVAPYGGPTLWLMWRARTV